MKSLLSFDPLDEKTVTDVTVSGSKVTIPAGKYREAVSKIVASATQATPTISVNSSTGLITASATQSAGYVSSGTKSATNQLPVQAAQTITPGTSNKTIASGKYLTGTQTIKGDANLIPANIVAGKSIFGVNGSFNISNAQLIVICPGATSMTVKNNTTTKTGYGSKNTFCFLELSVGTWTITATNGANTVSKNVNITNINDTQTINMTFDVIPRFTYTGVYQIVDDGDNIITETSGNWKIRFLTSGNLKFTELRGAVDGIDVFLVGGGGAGEKGTDSENNATGGGGGGGGYTKTAKNIPVNLNTTYYITIGGGGGATSGFNNSANGGTNGGKGGINNGGKGGNGGSGGGSGGANSGGGAGNGGSNGNNGLGTYIGTGQGTTTREFGESTGKLYAGGGGGGNGTTKGGAGGGGNGNSKYNTSGSNGMDNTGGGGGGGGYSTLSPAGKGGSGIIVIRNHRN